MILFLYLLLLDTQSSCFYDLLIKTGFLTILFK
jgi:hypothetical protein